MSVAGTAEISVIVPVYNAAPFIKACLESVLGHSRASLEIVCIDDGSTDHSVEVLERLAEADRRIRIHRLGGNHGASTARNMGIDRATGEYLCFVDADDTVPPGALDQLLAAARQAGTPLAIGKLLWLTSEEQAAEPLAQALEADTAILDIRDSAYLQSVSGSHCCNLYRRDLLQRHDIRYPTDLIYGEDQLFQASAFVHAGTVAMVDAVVYVYHHYRGESVTRRPTNLKNLMDDIEFQCRIARLFAAHGLPQAGLRFLGAWSYSIRQYWLQIPTILSLEEAVGVFTSFRKMIREFNVQPWNEATPENHRHLLGLVVSGQDAQAYSFLGTKEAR